LAVDIFTIYAKAEKEDRAYLGVLELLLDFVDDAAADLADEGTIEQLGADLARARDGTGDTHERADAVRPQIADRGYQRKVVERDGELAVGEVRAVAGGLERIVLEELGCVLGDEARERAAEIWRKAIVLALDRVSQHVVLEQQVTVVDVERGQRVLGHEVDLVDVDQRAVGGAREIKLGSGRSG
jgi:hypothetical protein